MEKEAEECSTVFERKCEERKEDVCLTVNQTRCEVGAVVLC